MIPAASATAMTFAGEAAFESRRLRQREMRPPCDAAVAVPASSARVAPDTTLGDAAAEGAPLARITSPSMNSTPTSR